MNIAANDVKLLRDRTGAGMMDCKKALAEANGDFDAAVEILRKKGQKVANNRADREANQGLIVTKLAADGSSIAVVELNCETDFVARNEEFAASAEAMVSAAFQHACGDVQELVNKPLNNEITVGRRLDELTGKIGEKIAISKALFLNTKGQFVDYIHPGNQLVTVVEFAAKLERAEIGRDVAMQVAAMKPVAPNRDSVPADLLAKELEIAKEQLINEGKSAEIAEKAAQGKIRRFYEESVLTEQKFVKDANLTVGQYLKQEGAPDVVSFKRIQLGAALV